MLKQTLNRVLLVHDQKLFQLGYNKTQPVVQFDEGTSKTFFQCQGVDSRMKNKGRGYGGRHMEVCCSYQYRPNTNIVKAVHS